MTDSRQPATGGDPAQAGSLVFGWIFVVLLLTVAIPASALAAPPVPGDRNPAILVGFEPDAGSGERTEALESVDGDISRAYRLVPGLRLVELPEEVDPAAARRQLAEMPGVAFASADAVMRIDRAPNDPLLSGQWGIDAIQAPLAWDTTTGSAEVAVAVIDTGVDLNHPDLAGNLWTNPDEIPANGIDDDGNGFVDDVHGWDFVGKDPLPTDDNSHGSHTAGTVGAVGNNGIGVAGVAWNVSLVPLKICSATGRCLTSDAIAALDYAVREGIPISNNSYGYNGSCTAAFSAALQAAGAAGHLFVASAGNDGRNTDQTPKYPASCAQENVLSVAWLADPKKLASRSNFGTTSVDLAAPGSQIQSTTPGGNYANKSGTSMAGPHVAGTAALLKSIEPSWDWRQLKERLMDSVTPACGLPVASEGTLDAGAAVSGEFIPDLACPSAPVILSGPAAEGRSTVATFTFTGAAGGAFSCQIDSNPPVGCASPFSYTGVTDGTHRFSVTQTAENGLESASSLWSWTVDTVAPNPPTVSASPQSPTTQKTASFTISGEARASFSCSLDGGPALVCSSPHSVSGLDDGPHSLVVFQSDRVGNRSNGTTREWTVDTVPPARPVIDSGPRPLTNESSASITFTGEAGTSARCRLNRDGTPGTWSGCSSPLNFTSLADGSYRLEIVLMDPAGQESAAAEWSWTVDTVEPAPPRIESGPGGSPLASVEISFSGEPENVFECRLESPRGIGEWESCSSPFTDPSAQEGSYVLLVRQIGPAGNVSAPASVAWETDTTPPEAPVIEGGPSGPVNTSQAEFLILGEAGALAECLLETGVQGGQWTDCPADGSWSDLEDGPKTLRVRLRDSAGNRSAETVRQWTVDTLPPAPPVLSGAPLGFSNSGTLLIAIETEADASSSCRLNEGLWSPCEDMLPLENLADGSYLLRVHQTDEAGNRSAETLAGWVVDTQPPDAPTVTGGPSGPSRSAKARFEFSGEDRARFECQLNAGPWLLCPTPVSFGPVAEGRHEAWFRQVDPAGNRSAATSRTWVMDSTPPAVRSADLSRIGRRGRYVLSVRASDAGSGPGRIEVSFSVSRRNARVDRVVPWQQIGRVSISGRKAPLWVRAVDRAGNRSAWVKPDGRRGSASAQRTSRVLT